MRSTTGARCVTDDGAHVRQGSRIDAADAAAARVVGHEPERRSSRSTRRSPTPTSSPTPRRASRPKRALEYMGLKAGTPIRDITVDTVFIGSCTNSPHRGPARRGRGRRQGRHVKARRAHAGRPGLDGGEGAGRSRGPRRRCSRAAGFDWREPGCSMCLAMNPDKLAPGERCASTSQPQLRGPSGQGRPHPPRLPRGRGRHRHRRPLRHAADGAD